MKFLDLLCCCCCCPRDYAEYDVILGVRESNKLNSKVPAENIEVPIQVNGGSQDSIFVNMRNKMSSWSLPKSQRVESRREERIHKFDEFLSEEERLPFDDQDAVSVTSRLSEILE